MSTYLRMSKDIPVMQEMIANHMQWLKMSPEVHSSHATEHLILMCWMLLDGLHELQKSPDLDEDARREIETVYQQVDRALSSLQSRP